MLSTPHSATTNLVPAKKAGAREIIRAKSPLRVSFSGGGTDLPCWYEKHRGAVFSATINRYAYAHLTPRDDREVHIHSVALGQSRRFHLNDGPEFDGVLDLAKAAIKRISTPHGMDLDVRSDAPPGSGLGGSSALTSAVLAALCLYGERSFDNYELAEMNYEIERIDLQVAGGKQDQYATSFGGFNLIEFSKEGVVVNSVTVDPAVVADLEAHLMLCYTGKVRADLGLVDRQMKWVREGQTLTSVGMRRLYELAFEMRDAVLDGRLDDFGVQLHDSYIAKKQMNPDITTGTIADELYFEARVQGAVGGKLLGAGGGGYLLLYCETARQHNVRVALEQMGGQFEHFAFESNGVRSWRSRCR